MNSYFRKSLCALSLFVIGASAGAAVIQSPVAATASSTFSGCCEIERTIDQSGLQSNFVSGVTDFDTYLATNPHHALAFQNEWFSNNATTATVTYDMGAIFSIGRVAYWNEDAANGRLMFSAYGSTDGTLFNLLLSNAVPTDHAIVDYPADVFGWAAQDMRYIRFELDCVWCAIGEVAFDVAPVSRVPEPGTLALFGLGFAGLVAAGRRRR